MMNLLGLPLDQALEILRREGLANPRIVYTASRRDDGSGTPRVVRISDDGTILCARFPDHAEQQNEDPQ